MKASIIYIAKKPETMTLEKRIIIDQCDDTGLRDRNLTQIRNTKTDVTKYKFIAVTPNQSN